MLLDGCPLSGRQLARLTALVPQHSLLLRSLCVEEALRFSAALRLGPGVTPALISRAVEAVLRELGLEKLRARRTFWGGAAQLSGGEQQRVSIAMELVAAPLVLFLDEPTSGLDSFSAAQVLRTLSRVAAAGRIVVTSLHQPSPSLFDGLDQALLLAKGCLVFQGPPAAAPAALAALGLPCPPGLAIAEHLLEVVGNPETQQDLLARVMQGMGSAGGGGQPSCPPAPQLLLGSKEEDKWSKPRPLLRELGLLTWRAWLDVLRAPTLLALHLLCATLLGLMVGFVYYQQSTNTAGAQNRVGAIFFAMNLFAFLAVSAIDAVQPERLVVERELSRHCYRPWLYALTKLTADALLLRILPGCLFCTLFYWLMGLRTSAAAFTTFLFVFCCYNCLVGAMSLACATIMGSPGKAVVLLNLLLLVFVLFSGFLANKASIPWALRWLCYISPIRFTWEALVVNELEPLMLQFSSPDLPPVPDVSGRVFLGLLGVDHRQLSTNIIVLNCLWLVASTSVLLAVTTRMGLLRRGWVA